MIDRQAATRSIPKHLALALGVVALAGCATFSKDGGFTEVERLTQARVGKEIKWARSEEDSQSVRATVTRLLGQPLGVEEAVQIALLNNPGLQADYAELGIAEADLVQAGRMTNPHFAYLRTSDSGERKLEWALTFPIIDLLTLPLRTKIEGRRFEQAKITTAQRAIDLAQETRRAWFHAVAGAQTVAYFEQVLDTAEAAAELGRRMEEAGNFNRLQRLREQRFYAGAVASLAQARHEALAQREQLTRLMGLYGEDLNYKLPGRLPDLPSETAALGDLEATAIAERLDVQAGKRETEWLAASLGLTKATRFINVLEAGPARTKEDPEPWKRGFEVSLEIPLFDWGGARVAKAEAIYMQAVSRLSETAVNARSQVREAYSGYRTAHDTARHYRDEIVPLQKKISDENLLRYNGMLIGVFELIVDAREQVTTVNDSIQALRDYWLAEADLKAALTGAGVRGAAMAGAAGGGRRMAAPALAGGH